MKFEMEVAHAHGGESWIEPEDRPEIKSFEAAQEWAVRCISRFNESLRPKEQARKLVDVRLVMGESDKHLWTKVNLVTISDGTGLYDMMRCSVCGVTAKRYGLGEQGMRFDKKYSAPSYQSCAKAQILFARKNKKR